MTPCTTFDQALSEYRDGVLSQVEQEKVESHLRECEVCSQSLEEFALVGSALVGERLAPLPRSLVRRLDRSFGGVSAMRRRERGRAFLTGGAAAAVLLLSVFCAYEYGKSNGVESDPIATHAVISGDEQIRAARAIASDLAVIDRVPEHLRIPLLKTQMETYQLAHWARETMTSGKQETQVNHLAGLLLELDPALRSKDATQQILRIAARAPNRSWVISNAPAKKSDTRKPTRTLATPGNQSFRFVIDSHLSESDRVAMNKTMMLKELIVRKDAPSALCAMVLTARDHGPGASPLRTIEYASIAAFSEELKSLGSAVQYVMTADGTANTFMTPKSSQLEFTGVYGEEDSVWLTPNMLLQRVHVLLGDESDSLDFRWMGESPRDGHPPIIIRRENQSPKKDMRK